MHRNYAVDFPERWVIDPPHLTHARNALRGTVLTELVAELNERKIGIWVPSDLLTAYGRATAVKELAGAKRRLYRSYITWTENYAFCGGVGDQVVDAILDRLRGRYIWVPPEHRAGQVREIGGRPIPYGPLDGTGLWVADPLRPSEGLVRFGAEVKNTRSILYPYHHEVWDLLAKLVDFPDVLPVLVARRIHYTTFTFFLAVGVLGIKTRQHWFSTSIDPDRFRQVTTGLNFRDAVQFDPTNPPPGLVKWFQETARQLAPAQLAKWAKSAPILAGYVELRDAGLDPTERQARWRALVDDLQAAGILPEPPDEEPADWDDDFD